MCSDFDLTLAPGWMMAMELSSNRQTEYQSSCIEMASILEHSDWFPIDLMQFPIIPIVRSGANVRVPRLQKK